MHCSRTASRALIESKPEIRPELAEKEVFGDCNHYLIRMTDRFNATPVDNVSIFFDQQPLAPASATDPELPVRVWFYSGTASNCIGKDGDFYLEDETNVLYGPKVNGAWPEDGVKVTGPVMKKKHKDPQGHWVMDWSQIPPKTKKHSLFLGFCKLLATAFARLMVRPHTSLRL
jgi:hypothetical protein